MNTLYNCYKDFRDFLMYEKQNFVLEETMNVKIIKWKGIRYVFNVRNNFYSYPELGAITSVGHQAKNCELFLSIKREDEYKIFNLRTEIEMQRLYLRCFRNIKGGENFVMFDIKNCYTTIAYAIRIIDKILYDKLLRIRQWQNIKNKKRGINSILGTMTSKKTVYQFYSGQLLKSDLVEKETEILWILIRWICDRLIHATATNMRYYKDLTGNDRHVALFTWVDCLVCRLPERFNGLEILRSDFFDEIKNNLLFLCREFKEKTGIELKMREIDILFHEKIFSLKNINMTKNTLSLQNSITGEIKTYFFNLIDYEKYKVKEYEIY